MAQLFALTHLLILKKNLEAEKLCFIEIDEGRFQEQEKQRRNQEPRGYTARQSFCHLSKLGEQKQRLRVKRETRHVPQASRCDPKPGIRTNQKRTSFHEDERLAADTPDPGLDDDGLMVIGADLDFHTQHSVRSGGGGQRAEPGEFSYSTH